MRVRCSTPKPRQHIPTSEPSAFFKSALTIKYNSTFRGFRQSLFPHSHKFFSSLCAALDYYLYNKNIFAREPASSSFPSPVSKNLLKQTFPPQVFKPAMNMYISTFIMGKYKSNFYLPININIFCNTVYKELCTFSTAFSTPINPLVSHMFSTFPHNCPQPSTGTNPILHFFILIYIILFCSGSASFHPPSVNHNRVSVRHHKYQGII